MYLNEDWAIKKTCVPKMINYMKVKQKGNYIYQCMLSNGYEYVWQIQNKSPFDYRQTCIPERNLRHIMS